MPIMCWPEDVPDLTLPWDAAQMQNIALVGTFAERTVLIKNVGGFSAHYAAASDDAALFARTLRFHMSLERAKWACFAMFHGRVRDARVGFFSNDGEDMVLTPPVCWPGTERTA